MPTITSTAKPPKPPNLLQTENLLFSSSSGSSGPQCAAYDFQYVGSGSGTKDVAYLLATGVSARQLQGGGEEALLRHYHAELLAGLKALAENSSSSGGHSHGHSHGQSRSHAGHHGHDGGPIGCPVAAAEAVEGYTFEAMQADYKVGGPRDRPRETGLWVEP